jgi:hypothetical protein
MIGAYAAIIAWTVVQSTRKRRRHRRSASEEQKAREDFIQVLAKDSSKLAQLQQVATAWCTVNGVVMANDHGFRVGDQLWRWFFLLNQFSHTCTSHQITPSGFS